MGEKTDTDLTTNWWARGLERCFMILRWEASRQLRAGHVKSWRQPVEPRRVGFARCLVGWLAAGVIGVCLSCVVGPTRDSLSTA